MRAIAFFGFLCALLLCSLTGTDASAYLRTRMQRDLLKRKRLDTYPLVSRGHLAFNDNDEPMGTFSNASSVGKHSRRHQPRWVPRSGASDEDWEWAVCKGYHMIRAILESDKEAIKEFDPPPKDLTVQSPFQDFPRAFQDWGWFEYDVGKMWPNMRDFSSSSKDSFGLSDALKGIKVSNKSTEEGGNIFISMMEHGPAFEGGRYTDVKNKPYQHNGKTYGYTEGHYISGVNTQEGVLMALTLKSPKAQLEDDEWKDLEKPELPELQRSSDVLYGVWKAHTSKANVKARSLRYYVVSGITNDSTQQIMVTAAELMGEVLKPWPGVEILMGRESEDDLRAAAVALLGNYKSTS